MTATLSISLGSPAVITVARGDGIPEPFWTRVLAEWGLAGPDPNSRVEVATEAFLANLDWLGPVCVLYSVGVEWDDPARQLVGRLRGERSLLDSALSSLLPLTPDQVTSRLAGSRFIRTLQTFQLRDVGKLLALRHGANFSVPGAGKTTTAYAVYEAERAAARVDRLLVVAPLSAHDAWITEAAACFSTPPVIHRVASDALPDAAEVCLVHYQRLVLSYEALARWTQSGRCHIILDEAHRMKRGWTGEWGRTSLNLAHLAMRRDVLTGTPAPQALRDLDALLDFAWPTQARRILPSAVFQPTPPRAVTQEVAKKIGPLYVRTTKSELGLPLPVWRVLNVTPSPIQLAVYAALRNQYAGAFNLTRNERSSFARMGQIVMYLLEAATNPRLLPFGARPDPSNARPRFPLTPIADGSSLADLIANYPDHEVPPKYAALGQILKENHALGRKTLVWTNFVENIRTLQETLLALQPAVVYGAIPSELSVPNGARTKEQEVDRFRNDDSCSVLIANPAAMSEGVSLHRHCHDAVYVDRTFNAGQYLQSVDRIHRLGLMPTDETRITFLVTTGTIDEIVNDRVREKAERLGAVLNDRDIATMALPGDDDEQDAIAEDDLEALFAHLRGDQSGAA